jgi:diadenosine tetraphosphate (Ap4A) HIT family hydrolase
MCPFCAANRTEKAPPLFSNNSCYFLETTDQVLQCSGIIIPFRHVATPFDLTSEEWFDTFDLLENARAHLDRSEPHGYNIGWNVGEVAGQTVQHAHLHVIGRFADEPLAGHGIRHHLKQATNRRI